MADRTLVFTSLLTAALAAPALAQPADPTAAAPAPAGEPAATDGAPADDDATAAPPAADADADAASATLSADAAPAADATPAPWHERVTLSGLVDGFIAIPLQGALRDGTPLRVFDGTTGSFLLAYAELTAQMAAEPAGFRVDLGFGPVADLTSLEVATNPNPPPETVTGPSEVWKHVQQAYASWKLPGKRAVVVDAGKFVTTAGAEVIEAKDNWLYTRSILFGYAIPFGHTGVRITAAIDDRLSVQAMIANGWDVGLDNNAAKTGGASVLYADAASGLTGALTAIAGKEAEDVRVLVDAVIGKKVSERLSINLNGDFGKDGDTSWYGAAGMVRVKAADALNLTVRAEHFQDPDGARTGVAGGTSITEVTGGAGLAIGPGGELRLEGRVDVAADDVFDGGTSSTQATVTAAALAWF